MKCLIPTKPFLEAFAAVASVAPTRSPKPVLQCLRLSVGDESTLSATDLEVSVRVSLDGIKPEQGGVVLLPTAKFGAILKTSADDELLLTATADGLTVRGRRSEFKLPGEDPEVFPIIPGFESTAYHVVSAADLRRAIRRCIFATDVASTRYAIGGVLFDASDAGLMLVATDGRRLATQTIPAEREGEPTKPASPVVPVKALKLIERSLDDDAPVHLAFTDRSVAVRTGGTVITSRLVDGRFPDFRQVFPTSKEATVVFPEVAELRRAVEQASVVTSEESRGVDFTFAPGVLRLASQAADVGSSTVDLLIDYEGPELVVTLDHRYALDLLRALADDVALTVDLIDAKNPVVVKSSDDYTHVLMPLTRER